jgi:hypothetical protein
MIEPINEPGSDNDLLHGITPQIAIGTSSVILIVTGLSSTLGYLIIMPPPIPTKEPMTADKPPIKINNIIVNILSLLKLKY